MGITLTAGLMTGGRATGAQICGLTFAWEQAAHTTVATDAPCSRITSGATVATDAPCSRMSNPTHRDSISMLGWFDDVRAVSRQ